MGRRIRLLGIALILCFALILVQLVNIQYHRAHALATSPSNPRNALAKFQNDRGIIYASDGTTVLAYSQSTHLPQGQYQYSRVYPGKSLYAGITGYSSIIYGNSGIEEQYDSYLASHPQQATTLGQLLNPPPPTTDNVRLTIKPNLQQVAATALAGRDGAVVAIQPTTGAVEALYSNPTYDPNGFGSVDPKTQFESALAANQPDPQGFIPSATLATEHTFPPGSTSKVVTTSAVFNLLPALVNYNVPSYECAPLPDTNKCLGSGSGQACGGTVTQPSMLPESCDPGYGLLGLKIFQTNANVLTKQAELYGYNQVPPLDLPDVKASVYPTRNQFLETGLPFVAYAAIGQGNVQTTALQNAMIAGGVANGGVVMVPHLLEDIHDAQGNLVQSFQPVPWMRALTQKAAAQITPLMQAVAQYGTAAGCLNLNLRPAVKTGTAQVGNAVNNTDDWMIGFAPANDPQIAVAVVVPYQAKSATGATVAGPIMNAMLQAAVGADVGSNAPTYQGSCQ
jgi:peptidoglycan glycosyltransferase